MFYFSCKFEVMCLCLLDVGVCCWC